MNKLMLKVILNNSVHVKKIQYKPLFVPYALDLLVLHCHLVVHIATHHHHDSPESILHLFTNLHDPTAYSG